MKECFFKKIHNLFQPDVDFYSKVKSFFLPQNTQSLKVIASHDKEANYSQNFIFRPSSYNKLTTLDQNPQNVMPTPHVYNNIWRQDKVLLRWFF